MSVNIMGGQSAADLEVENGHRAVRATLRPTDVAALGAFSVAALSGVMAAGIAANAPVFSLRYTGAGVLLLRKLSLSIYASTTAFTAGVGNVQAYLARNYTVSPSGGAAISLAPNTGKKRTIFGGSGVGDMRVSTTAALTAGTRTLDGAPFASVVFPVPVTVNNSLIPARTALFDSKPGEWPLVLAGNEGVEMQVNMPATGTWLFAVDTEWEEVPVFGSALAA